MHEAIDGDSEGAECRGITGMLGSVRPIGTKRQVAAFASSPSTSKLWSKDTPLGTCLSTTDGWIVSTRYKYYEELMYMKLVLLLLMASLKDALSRSPSLSCGIAHITIGHLPHLLQPLP